MSSGHCKMAMSMDNLKDTRNQSFDSWRRYKSNSGNISATNFPFLQIGHSRNLFNN